MNTQAIVSQSAATPGSSLVQVSNVLLEIIVLILAAAWIIKRLEFAPKSADTHGLKVAASTSLGPRERVMTVEVEDTRLVLGVAASQIDVLHTLPPTPVDAEEKMAFPTDSQTMMKSLLKRPGRS